MPKSDQSQLAFIRETTIGTTPATPAFTKFRSLSDTLSSESNLVDVAELDGEIGLTGRSLGGKRTGGSISMPFAYNDGIDSIIKTVLGKSTFTWIENATIDPSVARYGFTIEKKFAKNDGSFNYLRWSGATFSAFEMSFEPLSPINFSADVIGGSFSRDTAIITGATYGDALPTAANAPQMRSAKVSLTWSGSGSLPTAMANVNPTSMNIRIDRGTTTRDEISVEDSTEFSLGTLRPEIQMSFVYDGNAPVDAWDTREEFSLTVEVEDDVTNEHIYRFVFARCQIDSADVPTPGRNEDVVISLNITALQPSSGEVVTAYRDTTS